MLTLPALVVPVERWRVALYRREVLAVLQCVIWELRVVLKSFLDPGKREILTFLFCSAIYSYVEPLSPAPQRDSRALDPSTLSSDS